MASTREIPGFTRDPSLASGVADQFGGGAARAEELQDAVALRQTPELAEANLLPEDIEARGQWSNEDAEEAAGLPKGTVKGVTKRGNYLVYVYEVNDRAGKDALLIEDGELTLPDDEETPQRAALQAKAQAAAAVKDAEAEAAEIIRKAQEKAAKIVSEAAEGANEEQREAAVKTAEKVEKEGEPKAAEPRGGNSNAGDNAGRTGTRKPSEKEDVKPSDKQSKGDDK
jgi:hypothetical protein